jgi:hypothetical protein
MGEGGVRGRGWINVIYDPEKAWPSINNLILSLGWPDREARIFKIFRSPRINFKESIPPAYVAWRAGTTTQFLLGSQPPQIV